MTKRYHVRSPVADGLKSLLLHLPSQLQAIRRRKPLCALEDVSFELMPGECLSVIGRNGAGKSTALGLIAGVLRPTSGDIETRGRICPLLELGAGFHFELSARDNIILNGILLGLTRREVLDRVDDIVAFSELSAAVNQPMKTFSSGMIARLGFSVAVHLTPDILLVDEVLSVGDEAFKRKCLTRMQTFREQGTTMVFVSHDMTTIEKISDRVALIESGKLVELGEPARVIACYRDRLKAA